MAKNLNDLRHAIIEKLDIPGYFNSELGVTIDNLTSEGWSKKRFLCPFHEDRKNAAFFINGKTGGFHCKTCNARGSIFDFWMLRNGYQKDDAEGFKKSLSNLADIAGINIKEWMQNAPEVDPKKKSKQKERPVVNLANEHDRKHPPIPENIVDNFHELLITKQKEIEYLVNERGLSFPTIKIAKIGFDNTAKWKTQEGRWGTGRITIPVPNETGEIRNIRKHSRQASHLAKMINHKVKQGTEEISYGSPPRLYNLHRMIAERWEHVVICEGEFDSILLTQELHEAGFLNWGAVSGTHGTTFQKEWATYFRGRHVYFCYDCDEAGIVHSEEFASEHFGPMLKLKAIRSLKVLKLPLEGTSNLKDVTDYFVKCDRSIHDFLSLCEETQPRVYSRGESSEKPIDVSSYVEAMRDDRYIDCRIRVPISITGNTDRLYHAPLKVKITKCPKMEDGNCCMRKMDTHKIPHGHPIYIEACNSPVGVVKKALASMVCGEGQKVSVKILDKAVMEQLIVSQVVGRWKAEKNDEGQTQNTQELVTTPVYLLRDRIDSFGPQNYEATGYVRTNPKTSGACMFIDDLRPLEDDWKSFDDSAPYNQNLLYHIQKMSVNDILRDITNHVTKIYKSDDLLLSVLLTYLAPLHFRFNGDLIRGWINTCIIGDSGTGKSDTYMRISDWIEVGDLFSALSGTRTGLLYNLQQKNNEWSVRIGRYVQCNQKILAVDETQEMENDQIKPMAIAMDTGWLQVERVASGGYTTETRVLFLMNPVKFDRAATIGDFTYGCESLRHSFDPMFIRRIDLAVFTSRMHKCSFYNRRHTEEEENEEMKLSPLMLRSLIFWAWTRKPDNIIWEEDAIEECLSKAGEISDKFGRTDAVPLAAPQDMRKKLARLSTAFAVLDGSISEDFQNLHVKPSHVRKVTKFLTAIYSFATCSLDKFSEQSKRKTELEEDDELVVIKNQMQAKADEYCSIPGNIATSLFLKVLLEIRNCEVFSQRQLGEIIGGNRSDIRIIISFLRSLGFLEPFRGKEKATRKFNLFMREWESDDTVRKNLENVRIHYSTHMRNSGQQRFSTQESELEDNVFSQDDEISSGFDQAFLEASDENYFTG